MAKIIWTESALSHLNAIADHIAKDNADAANRLVRQLFNRCDLLENFPELGRLVPETRGPQYRERGYREIVVPPCRVVYRIDGDVAVVILVLRGEQRLLPEMIVTADS